MKFKEYLNESQFIGAGPDWGDKKLKLFKLYAGNKNNGIFADFVWLKDTRNKKWVYQSGLPIWDEKTTQILEKKVKRFGSTNFETDTALGAKFHIKELDKEIKVYNKQKKQITDKKALN